MAPYTKSYLTLKEQLSLLQERGMCVSDEEKALSYLERIGYYRLSGYWYPFRESEHITNQDGKTIAIIHDNFRSSTEFSYAVELYVFDKRLRLLLLDAVERIEVALRVDIADLLGKRNPLAHLLPDELHGNFAKKVMLAGDQTKHQKWVNRLDTYTTRSSEDFLVHFRTQYGDTAALPIWIAIELWDFGQLSTFFGGMKVIDQQAIAIKYGIARCDLFANWIHVMNYVRNLSAHHSRLWNRALAIKPKLPKVNEGLILAHLVGNTHAQSHLYSVVALMQYLLRTINPSSSWGKRLTAHMQAFPTIPGLSVHHAGFPEGWEQLALWQ